jgi:hypothetical protein
MRQGGGGRGASQNGEQKAKNNSLKGPSHAFMLRQSEDDQRIRSGHGYVLLSGLALVVA